MSQKLKSKSLGIFLVFATIALTLPNLTQGLSRGSSPLSRAALQVQTAPQEDPFYKKLYDEGKYFYQNKNYAGAIEDFGIAFFGYLDNPPRLLECYVYLAVCHFEQKNYEKAKSYVEEIRRLKLEEHTKAANLPEDLAKRYQEIVGKLYKAPAAKQPPAK
jgi:tetratricopeptide (TPR) repeat protein